ncbi:MAG: methyltransferase [Fuerstiella sp.]|nr:methyltransferase [Fuerstiella sp.]
MNVRRWYAAPLMRVNKMLAPRIRNSRLITRWFFGVDVQKGRRVQYWDYTTLVFRQALLKHVQPRSRTLEIGVGEHAILSIFLCKHVEVTAFGVDLEPSAVEHACRTVKKNAVNVDLRQSDMFEACSGAFDVVFWNPPYVPRDAPAKGVIGGLSEVATDGGSDGMELIRRFVKCVPDYLDENGRVLLGFSSFYVETERILELVAQSSLEIEEFIAAFPNPSQVCVLRRRRNVNPKDGRPAMTPCSAPAENSPGQC